MFEYLYNIRRNLRPGVGAGNLLLTSLIFGIALGAFSGVLNNFLAQIRHFDNFDRGVLEFFRETPGLLLVFILALMCRLSEWKILRIGMLIAIIGVGGIIFSGRSKLLITVLIMIWSTGEHILMPVRNSIAMHVASPGKSGLVLGMLGALGNIGQLAGGLIAAAVFYFTTDLFTSQMAEAPYTIVWTITLLLVVAALLCAFPRNTPDDKPVRRPRLVINRKYHKYYALELFYGARKQIFLTFAPYVLILNYGLDTEHMAILLGVCAAANVIAGPFIGVLIDRWGYRNVMIYDTVVLAVVCLVYGFADRLFSPGAALTLVLVNFILDAVISNCSIASSIYVKQLSSGQDEVTGTLTTGLSINHLISVLAALFGGWVWKQFGVGYLFVFAAAMALGNTWYATTIPRPAPASGK